MGLTVTELLARTSSYELTEWRAYEKEFGPLGPERGDFQTALVAYMVASANAGKKARRLKLTDFLLPWSRKRAQTAEEHLSIFRALAARQQGTRTDARGELDS